MALNTLVLATVFALAHAAPSYEQASNEITMLLQQGNDESACADLAKALIDEVTSTVDQSNKLLGALDDGSSCPNEGQDAVTAAQNNNNDAEKAASDAAEAASAAADADIDFGSYSFSTLTEGECGQFWKDDAYVAAKDAQGSTATAQTEADAKAKATAEALDDATAAAASAVKACQCKVRAAYDAAWAAATEKEDADAAAYTKGKHMACVLQGTAAADCDVGDAPKPTPIKLADGVPAEPCTEQVTEETCQKWTRVPGNYLIKENNKGLKGKECEALFDVDTAKVKCEEASDCNAIGSKSNMCDGKFRVNHGVSTTITRDSWDHITLVVYTLDRSCMK